MRQLYTTRVVRPFPPVHTPRSYLNYTGVAWCPYHDLIAVISGCGAVAVFHPDSPSNVALLTTVSNSPAKHVAWRKSLNYPPLLAVADESLSITFWVSINRRVNEWHIADIVHTSSQVLAFGWNSTGSALAASLSDGHLSAWFVPDYHSVKCQPYASIDPSPNSLNSSVPKFPTSVRPLPFVSHFDTAQLLGGHLQCASIASGHVDPNSIALVTVTSAEPTSIFVWQIFFTEGFTAFDVRRLATTTMQPLGAGACIACAIVPPSGMLFAISCHGIIARWRFQKARSGVQRGWHLQQHARIQQEIKDAASRALIINSQAVISSPNFGETGKPVYHSPDIYAFQVSHDCESMIFATSAGVLLWDVESFKVYDGHCSDTVSCTQSAASQHGSIWGLCFSPTASTVFAANSKGFANVFTIIYPIAQTVTNSRDSGTIVAASKLVDITHPDGLQGGWDLLAPISFEGPSAAAAINYDLTYGIFRSLRPIPPSPERIKLAKDVLRNLLDADDAVAIAAENLLRVAVDAIESSGVLPVKASLSLTAKDIKSYSSPAFVAKAVERAISSTSSVSPQQLASAPLADWIMTLCSVWLQRCAQVLSSYDPKGGILKAPWVAVVSMIPHHEKNSNSGRGIVFDIALITALRPASVAAVYLLDIYSHFMKQEAPVRHHRFSRNDAHCILAAFWEVSQAWESACLSDKSKKWEPSIFSPSVQTERMLNAAVVLGKHLVAANVLAEAKELRVHIAEEALGLRGATRGAGFIMSCIRSHKRAAKGARNIASEAFTESCKYDMLTGRRLTSGMRLRRCVVSGLLAVDYAGNMTEGGDLPPWVTKWNNKSPFGGQWAVVTSQRVDTSERVFSLPQFLPSPKVVPSRRRRTGKLNSQTTTPYDPQVRPDAIRKAHDVLSQSPQLSSLISNPEMHQNHDKVYAPTSSGRLSTPSHNDTTTNDQQQAKFTDSDGRHQSPFVTPPFQIGDVRMCHRGKKRELCNKETYTVSNKRSSKVTPKFEGTPVEVVKPADIVYPPTVHGLFSEGMPSMVASGMSKFETGRGYVESNGPSKMPLHTPSFDIKPSSVGTASVGTSHNVSIPPSQINWVSESPHQEFTANATVTTTYPPEISISGLGAAKPHVSTSNLLSSTKFVRNGALLESSGIKEVTNVANDANNKNIHHVPVDMKSSGNSIIPQNGWNVLNCIKSINRTSVAHYSQNSPMAGKQHLKRYCTDECIVAHNSGQESHAFVGSTIQSLTPHGLPPKSEQVVVDTPSGPGFVKVWNNYRPSQGNNVVGPWHVETNTSETYVPISRTGTQELSSSIGQNYIHSPCNISNAYRTNKGLNVGGKFVCEPNVSAGKFVNLPSSSGNNKTRVNINGTYFVGDLEYTRNGRANANPLPSVRPEDLISDWGEEEFKDGTSS